MREDHLRYLNPTPYKVSTSEELHAFITELYRKESVIKEIN